MVSHPDEVEPKSKEGTMPNPPYIHDMCSWNVLIPYYKETIILSKGKLETRSETMLYL